MDNPGSWTLAEVQVKNISVTTLGVDIFGDRLGVLYTAGNPSLIKVSKMKIHIDANTRPELDLILPKIFVDPKEELRPLVPDYWKYFMAPFLRLRRQISPLANLPRPVISRRRIPSTLRKPRGDTSKVSQC